MYIYDQQSVQFNKVKECNMRSICGQQPFCFLRAHQHSSDQMKILCYIMFSLCFLYFDLV